MKVKGTILGVVVVAIVAAVPFALKINASVKSEVQNAELTVSKQIEIGDFEEVEVSQGIKVILTQRENPGVANVQTTQEMESLLRVEAKGNKLKIYYDNNNGSIKTEKKSTIVKVNTMTLKEVEASSAAEVIFWGNFNLDNELEIETSSASRVFVKKVTCPKLELSASSASNIEVEEVAGILDVDASSASNITVKSIKGSKLEAEASSASSINIEKIYCEKVEAEASSTAKIYLAGVCGNFKKETSSAGRISYSKLSVRKTVESAQ